MGQALDRDGNVLGERYGDTKAEVFEALNREFKDAHEIRIRSMAERLDRATGQAASNPADLIRKMVAMAERWRRESGTAGWQLGKESCAQDLVALVKAVQAGEVVIALRFPDTLPAL